MAIKNLDAEMSSSSKGLAAMCVMFAVGGVCVLAFMFSSCAKNVKTMQQTHIGTKNCRVVSYNPYGCKQALGRADIPLLDLDCEGFRAHTCSLETLKHYGAGIADFRCDIFAAGNALCLPKS